MRIIGVIAFFLFTALPSANTAEQQKFADVPEFQAPRILGFARHLLKKKEYYRAYAELNRLKAYYPDYLSPQVRHISELYLLFNGGQYNDILCSKYEGEKTVPIDITALYQIDVYITLGKISDAYSISKSYYKRNSGDPLNRLFCKRLFFTSLFMGQRDLALNSLEVLRTLSTGPEQKEFNTKAYRELLEYSGEMHSRYKNPGLAMLFGIVPGAGYAYAGNRSTGIIAFATVSICATLSYFSYATGNKSLAVFFGIGTLAFYGGSVIGSYREAIRHNRWMEKKFLNDARSILDFEGDRNMLINEYGIGNESIR